MIVCSHSRVITRDERAAAEVSQFTGYTPGRRPSRLLVPAVRIRRAWAAELIPRTLAVSVGPMVAETHRTKPRRFGTLLIWGDLMQIFVKARSVGVAAVLGATWSWVLSPFAMVAPAQAAIMCSAAPHPGVDYYHCNLAGADFSGADLSGLTFKAPR